VENLDIGTYIMKISVENEEVRLDEWLKGFNDKTYKKNYKIIKSALESEKKGFEFTLHLLLENNDIKEFVITKAE